jgi:SNF2 family DNA or RNA helicase
MTPYEIVREVYAFPFDFRQYQKDEFNYLAPFDRAGYYWDPGTGKTAGSTHHALYWKITAGVDQWVVVQPPILLLQWERWLKSVRRIADGEPPTVTVYTGTPAQRKRLSLDSEFILVSYGMFKNDFDRFLEHFQYKKVGTIADEATAIKNIESDNHKAVKMFSEGRPLLPLTGTPLAKPIDAYAYIRLLTGNKIYRNKRHFEQMHVEEMDEYDRVTKWANLDLLAENMKVQSSRIIRREVRKELPSCTYQLIPYDLHPAHLKLYNRVAEEQLVELDNGQEINAITAARLRSAMQQIVCNWGYFEGDSSKRPAVLDVIDNTMEELGPDKKLMLVANFQMTNRYLLEALQKYGAVAIYGEVSPAKKSEALERFIEDPACRLLQVQPQSAGMGLDGLQAVCSDMLVIEAPSIAFHFHQTVARLDRDGQENPVLCRIAIAQKTVQVKLFRDLLNNDEMVNSIQGGYQDLRNAIFGQ